MFALLFFNTKTESQTLEGVIMNLSELRNSLFHSSCLKSGWCCWWIDGGGGSFLLDLKKEEEKLASIRRKDIRTKHSNYSRLLILWVFRSCLPPPTFYPSHNIGFLLQKSNKEVVPPLKEKNRRQDLLANMPAWLQGTPTWKMDVKFVNNCWSFLLMAHIVEMFISRKIPELFCDTGASQSWLFWNRQVFTSLLQIFDAECKLSFY